MVTYHQKRINRVRNRKADAGGLSSQSDIAATLVVDILLTSRDRLVAATTATTTEAVGNDKNMHLTNLTAPVAAAALALA